MTTASSGGGARRPPVTDPAGTRAHAFGPRRGRNRQLRAHARRSSTRSSGTGWRAGSGDELVAYREGLGLSQAKLAERSGVSERWIRELESGRGRPSDGICRRLALGLFPDHSALVQAVVDLRLRRFAGRSLVLWDRRRPVGSAHAYEQAAAIVDAQPDPPATGVDAWMEIFDAVWFGGDQPEAGQPDGEK